MENIVDTFSQRKKANSEYVSLGDGESIDVKRVVEFKIITKMGYGGEEKEMLRMMCEVETLDGVKLKKFDNATQRWAEELQKNNIGIGSAFTLTRTGQQTKTRYTISKHVAGQPQTK